MGVLKNFRFPSRDSYRAVASGGRLLCFSLLNLKVLPAPDGCSRFCFVVKKKNGCAVFRNRCRRVLRDAFFGEAKNIESPLWVMALVKMGESSANWDAFRGSAFDAITKLRAAGGKQ